MKKFFLMLIFFFFICTTSSYAVPTISAKNAIAIETSSGRILYEKDAFKRVPMASTTKIMTAIVAVENNLLDDIVIVSKKAAWTGGSSVDLKEGDKITLSELLYGLMLNSGNDAAVAIAEHTSGTIEEFAKLMNNKAQELGALNTNFVTPHGLDANNHYSTAYDMAIIAKHALQNPTIAKLVSTQSYTMSFINGKTKHLSNTNPLLPFYEGITGVKTGYTGLAGKCLVASAKRDNLEIIAVFLGSSSSKLRISDSTKTLNYCFENYKLYDLKELFPINFSIPILKCIKNDIKPIYERSLFIPLTKDEAESLTVKKIMQEKITAPIEINQQIGKIQFSSRNEFIGELNLCAPYYLKRKNILNYFSDIGKTYFNYPEYIN